MTPIPASLRRTAHLPPFDACTDAELAFIASRTNDHHARAGDVLAHEGRRGREWIVLVEGTALVTVGGTEVARLGPGDPIGELSLLDDGVRTATVVAETDVEVLVASASEFTEIVAGVPAVARALLVALARRLRATDALVGPGGPSDPLPVAALPGRARWALR